MHFKCEPFKHCFLIMYVPTKGLNYTVVGINITWHDIMFYEIAQILTFACWKSEFASPSRVI